MTAERAVYLRLMLEIGRTESFDRELDELLEREDPLSELTLSLSTCGGDRNRQISILREYARSVPEESIDDKAVFSLVIGEFRAEYEADPEALEALVHQMSSAAWYYGRWTDDPWNGMYYMQDWYGDIAEGLPRELFLQSLRMLLYTGEVLDPLDALRERDRRRSLPERLRALFGAGRSRKRPEPRGNGSPSGELFLPCPERRGSAYVELQFCREEGSPRKLLKNGRHWERDSLLVSFDDLDRWEKAYLPFLASPETPDGRGEFCIAGVNYYSRERAGQLLREIEAARPEGYALLLPWLRKAALVYHGFYVMGI